MGASWELVWLFGLSSEVTSAILFGTQHVCLVSMDSA